eukprot:jgi/Chlat1/5664/Chrsp37S09012
MPSQHAAFQSNGTSSEGMPSERLAQETPPAAARPPSISDVAALVPVPSAPQLLELTATDSSGPLLTPKKESAKDGDTPPAARSGGKKEYSELGHMNNFQVCEVCEELGRADGQEALAELANSVNSYAPKIKLEVLTKYDFRVLLTIAAAALLISILVPALWGRSSKRDPTGRIPRSTAIFSLCCQVIFFTIISIALVCFAKRCFRDTPREQRVPQQAWLIVMLGSFLACSQPSSSICVVAMDFNAGRVARAIDQATAAICVSGYYFYWMALAHSYRILTPTLPKWFYVDKRQSFGVSILYDANWHILDGGNNRVVHQYFQAHNRLFCHISRFGGVWKQTMMDVYNPGRFRNFSANVYASAAVALLAVVWALIQGWLYRDPDYNPSCDLPSLPTYSLREPPGAGTARAHFSLETCVLALNMSLLAYRTDREANAILQSVVNPQSLEKFEVAGVVEDPETDTHIYVLSSEGTSSFSNGITDIKFLLVKMDAEFRHLISKTTRKKRKRRRNKGSVDIEQSIDEEGPTDEAAESWTIGTEFEQYAHCTCHNGTCEHCSSGWPGITSPVAAPGKGPSKTQSADTLISIPEQSPRDDASNWPGVSSSPDKDSSGTQSRDSFKLSLPEQSPTHDEQADRQQQQLSTSASASDLSVDSYEQWLRQQEENSKRTNFLALIARQLFSSWKDRALHVPSEKVLGLIYKERSRLDRPLLLAGHSLGGALAMLCAYELRASFLQFPLEDLACYAFGSPRIGNLPFALKYNELVKNSFRVVVQQDMVSKVPLAITGFKHAGTLALLDMREKNLHLDPTWVEEMLIHRLRFGRFSNHPVAVYRAAINEWRKKAHANSALSLPFWGGREDAELAATLRKSASGDMLAPIIMHRNSSPSL